MHARSIRRAGAGSQGRRLIDLPLKPERLEERRLAAQRGGDEVAIPERHAVVPRVGGPGARQVVVSDRVAAEVGNGNLAPEIVQSLIDPVIMRCLRVLIEDLRGINSWRNEDSRIVGLRLVAMNQPFGHRAQKSTRDTELAGDAVVGRVRIKQRILDVSRPKLGRHAFFERDDGLGVHHGSFAMANEMQIDRSAGGELAGRLENFSSQTRPLHGLR